MDYGGGQTGDQVSNLGMSVDGLNATIGSLQQSIAAFSQSMARNTTVNSGTALGTGGGIVGNAASAASMVMPPMVSEISPGMFFQQPAGMVHNALASMGVVGQAGGPLSQRMSPVEYQNKAYGNFREQAAGGLSGMAEGLLSGGVAGALSASTAFGMLGGTAASIAGASVGMAGYAVGMGIDAAYGHMTGQSLGETASRTVGAYQYNRNLEAKGIIAQSGLTTTPGRSLQGYEVGAYGAALSETVAQTSTEMGMRSTWFGGKAKRLDEAEMMSAIESSGIMSKMGGSEKSGQLTGKMDQFQANLKDSIQEIVKLAEVLQISKEDAAKQLDKIMSYSGKKTFTDPASSVKKFFGDIGGAAASMDIAPMQAMDYMANMQNMYSTTGLLDEKAWGKIGVQAMMSGGAQWRAGQAPTKEAGLNQAANTLTKAAIAFASDSTGVGPKAFTETLSGMGEEGYKKTEAFLASIDENDPAGAAEKIKAFAKENFTRENILSGTKRADTAESRKWQDKINALVAIDSGKQSLMWDSRQDIFAALDSRDMLQVEFEQARTRRVNDGLGSSDPEQDADRAKKDVANMLGDTYTNVSKEMLPSTQKYREQAAAIGKIGANLRLNTTMIQTEEEKSRFNPMRYIPEMLGGGTSYVTKSVSNMVSDEYIKNVMSPGMMTDGFKDRVNAEILSGEDVGAKMDATEKQLAHTEAWSGIQMAGLKNMSTSSKEAALGIMDRTTGTAADYGSESLVGRASWWSGAKGTRNNEAISMAIMGEAALAHGGKVGGASQDDLAAATVAYTGQSGETALGRVKDNWSALSAGMSKFDADGEGARYAEARKLADNLNAEGQLGAVVTSLGGDPTQFGKNTEQLRNFAAGLLMNADAKSQEYASLHQTQKLDVYRYLSALPVNMSKVSGDMALGEIAGQGASASMQYQSNETRAAAGMARMSEVASTGATTEDAAAINAAMSDPSGFKSQMEKLAGESVTNTIMQSDSFVNATKNQSNITAAEMSGILKQFIEKTSVDMSPDKALMDSTAGSDTDTRTGQAVDSIRDAFTQLASCLKSIMTK